MAAAVGAAVGIVGGGPSNADVAAAFDAGQSQGSEAAFTRGFDLGYANGWAGGGAALRDPQCIALPDAADVCATTNAVTVFVQENYDSGYDQAIVDVRAEIERREAESVGLDFGAPAVSRISLSAWAALELGAGSGPA